MKYLQIMAAVMAMAVMAGEPAAADTLLVTAVKQEAGVRRPWSGMTMSQVEQKFGQPQRKLSAVGDPPITRWVYQKYVVYFERNRVIHAVVIRH